MGGQLDGGTVSAILIGSVFMPRAQRNASMGAISDALDSLNSRICVMSASVFALETPPTTSPWPLMYLVTLCNEMSAPRASG